MIEAPKANLNIYRNLSADILAILLCLLFLIMCFTFSTKVNLWGDEAFSLDLAESSWQTIFYTVDTHLPMYTFLLKLLISLTGSNADREVFIRLWHAVPFAIGLFLGYRTVGLVTQSRIKALYVLLAAIFLPSFIFYATNIRMYSLLFLNSMMFINSIAYLMSNPDVPCTKQFIWFISISFFLILTDYPGLIFYGMGSSFLIWKIMHRKQYSLLVLMFCPLIAYLIYIDQLRPGLEKIITWHAASPTLGTDQQQDVKAIIKWIHKAFHPVFDFVNPMAMSLWMSLFIPGILTVDVVLGSIAFLWKKQHCNILRILLVCFALLWLLEVPTGMSITRAFLPSLFFMVAILVIGFSDFYFRPLLRVINLSLFTLLLFINIQQIFNPTLQICSMIPYQQIAKDCLYTANKEHVDTIVLSDNTLNSLSIKRYLRQYIHSSSIQIILLSLDFTQQSIPKQPFVFVSHMHEDGRFIDVQYFEKKFGKLTRNLENYIELERLPFNQLWRNEVVGKTSQKFAVSTYMVRSE